MQLKRSADLGDHFSSGSGALPDAQLIKNGSFTTGNFHDWTLFTTASGTLGYPNDPKVTRFDVTGSGPQKAAEFQVGQAGDVGTEEGGGIEQTIVTQAGMLDFSADIAAFTSKQINLEGGTFSVLVDGVTEDTVVIGSMPKHTVERGQLAFEVPVTAGSHQIEILITRDFTDGTRRGQTPFEYVTNISATQPGTARQGPGPGALPASPHAFAAAAATFGVPAAASAPMIGEARPARLAMIALPHAAAA